jgi:asparagine synthase (glutamine-hydrolysing)
MLHTHIINLSVGLYNGLSIASPGKWDGNMCGIAGWIGRGAADDAETMLACLKHRGPDARGIRSFDGATLIHARLSIIDLSPLGEQPMSNEDGSIWVVFNGEIYNHHGIRASLEAKGHTFRGRSDTEIIPHLYEEYGADLVMHLRGMFTIALYDTRRRRLLLARDRFGIKPLFYAPTPERIAFASELNALRALPDVNTTPDAQAIFDYTALFYIPAPATFYTGICALEPGTLLEADLDGAQPVHTVRRWYDWRIAPDNTLTLDAAAAKADALVQTAVGMQLESDVPLGSLLSGGIDSSLVSGAAQAALDHPLLTYNVRFADAQYDETWAAQAVAAHIGSQHMTLDMPTGEGTWAHITGLLSHAGQPYADTSVFAAEAVCRLMRQHVTVALSGDGGDEAFGGYDFYARAPQFAAVLAVPHALRRPLMRGGAVLARLAGRTNLGFRLAEMSAAGDAVGMVEAMLSWIRSAEHAALMPDGGRFLPVRRHFEPQWTHDISSGDMTERVSALLTEGNTRIILPNDFLFKVDIASMRNGLEVRVPMLDEELFAWGLNLRHALKHHAGVGKQVLRAVAARRLPERVANKPKWGFGIPVDTWADAAFKQRLRETLLGPNARLRDVLDPAAYTPMVEGFAQDRPVPGISRIGLYQRAIMLLSLELHLGGAA